MAVDKSLGLCYQLVECRMICKNTKAACIKIYCSSLQQKSEVILYNLLQTSHEVFKAIILVSDYYCEWISGRQCDD